MLIEHLQSQSILAILISLILVGYTIYKLYNGVFEENMPTFYRFISFFFGALPILFVLGIALYFILDISSYSIQKESENRKNILLQKKAVFCYDVNNNNFLSMNIFSNKAKKIENYTYFKKDDLIYLKNKEKTFHILNCFPTDSKSNYSFQKYSHTMFNVKNNKPSGFEISDNKNIINKESSTKN